MPKARIAIVVSAFNKPITASLLNCCWEELLDSGVKKSNIRVVWVPGAYELPFMANKLAKSKRFNAVICLGCVIKGETAHDTFVSLWAAVGIGQVALQTGVPTIFGVLTPKSEKQAWQRAKPGKFNRGKEVAEAAIHMIALSKEKN